MNSSTEVPTGPKLGASRRKSFRVSAEELVKTSNRFHGREPYKGKREVVVAMVEPVQGE